MRRFVFNELPVEEFVPRIFYQLLGNMEQYNYLVQVTLQLNPEIFQFSIIIGDYLFVMVKAFDQGEITETNLRQVVKYDILPKVEKYLYKLFDFLRTENQFFYFWANLNFVKKLLKKENNLRSNPIQIIRSNFF